MSLNSTDEILDECVSRFRFVPNGKGLDARYEIPRFSPTPLEPGEYSREITLGVEASQDHGIITVPVRLPRYLMPGWSQDDWSQFIDSEVGFVHKFVDEAIVQCLSLALVADSDRRKEILRTADEVVVDFRGDLPNKYLPMMLGGYKVGVYRSGNKWPVWLSIQPTYDLAHKEAERIRTEAGLPKNKSITAAGKLADYLNVKTPLGSPILSSSAVGSGIGGWIATGAIVVISLVAWVLKSMLHIGCAQ
jgi:hypothetical protein